MAHELEDQGSIANRLLGEFPLPNLAAEGGVSPAAADAYREYAGAVNGLIENGENYRSKRAELRANGHKMPPAGLEEEHRRARKEAEGRGHELSFQAKRAFGALEAALSESALPRLDPAREQLARQELDVALADKDAEAAALAVATNGSREATAALFSDYGRTKLRAAGVDDQRVLAEARKAAAEVAIERGSNVREVTSSQTLRKIGRLAAARTAASLVLSNALREDERGAQRAIELREQQAEAQG